MSSLRAVVEVQVRRSGEVVDIKVREKSGDVHFDNAAMLAVRRASPLPPVPGAIVQNSTVLLIRFSPGQVS